MMSSFRERYLKFANAVCEAAGTPELYTPIEQIFTICEGIDGDASDGVDAKETTTTTIDMNKLPEGEIDELKADLSKAAEANTTVDQAKKDLAASLTSDASSDEINTKINEYSTANNDKGKIVADMTKKLNAANAAAEQPNATE